MYNFIVFYVYAIGSMLGYALQQTLLVHHARKIDGLSLAFYRNISFVITLLPLLIGASLQDIQGVLSQWPMLMISGFSGAIYLALLFASYKFLSVGIGTSISRALSITAIVLAGWWFLGEGLSFQVIIVIGVIILGTVLLGVQHERQPHLDSRFALGILCLVLSAVPIAYINYTLATLSREWSPFVSGYFWEISIGIACFVLLLLRGVTLGKPLQKISRRTFLLIAACSAPTLVGTAFFSLALRDGPVGIVNAIGSGLLVVSALLALVWYNEKLNVRQWASMMIIVAGIAALKFV